MSQPRWFSVIALLCLGALSACGGASPQTGHPGSGGSDGGLDVPADTAGSSGGSTGTGGHAAQGTGGSNSGGTGATSEDGGTAGGRGGTTDTGGRGGSTGVGGSGGGALAGMGGGAHGGGGGSTACQQVVNLDRSCTTSADCVVGGAHQTNCCGAAVWLGVRAAEAQAFATLERTCGASYPACGCASGSPTTDDGSVVARGGSGMVSVSCQAGTCTTFAAACGQPCAAGRSCLTCGGPDAGVSVCSLRCMGDTNCTETPYSKCQAPFGNGVCTDPKLACALL